MDAYIAPLQELVAWRQARRSLRGRIDAAGQVVLVTDDGRTSSGTIRFEEPSGG
jgi:hypothetical protein